MLVTFKSNARIGKYSAGKVYTEELTPVLKAILDRDIHLQLIDPPTLDPPKPAPKPAPAPTPVKEEKPVASESRDQSTSEESRPTSGPRNGNGSSSKSAERSEGDSIDSAKVGRD